MTSDFSVRVRIGEKEVELRGSKEEVFETLDSRLDYIVDRVSEAFQNEEVEELVEEAEEDGEEEDEEDMLYPDIGSASSCSEGILKVMETPWGKRPRTLGELREALKANDLFYPTTTMSSVLISLVRQGKLRRWKTSGGYVYVLR